jgi:transcriptional regulator with XRE-family HTH domain
MHVAVDQGPVVQSAMLRSELTRLRKESGLTHEEVASELEWSPSKLIKIEGGRSSLTSADLNALLIRYGISSEDTRERLQTLNRGAREPAWWARYGGDIGRSYLEFVGFETGSSFIRQYENAFVPGTLQTPEYAEAVTVGLADPIQVASVVALRLRRQSELATRSVPPRRDYVMDEAVIRRHVGISTDPAIMPNQIRSIADKAEADDSVTVRVMPFAAGAHRGLLGAFTLLEFDGGLPDVLYIDAGRGEQAIMFQSNDVVADYRSDFAALLEDALPTNRSIYLLRSVAEEMS